MVVRKATEFQSEELVYENENDARRGAWQSVVPEFVSLVPVTKSAVRVAERSVREVGGVLMRSCSDLLLLPSEVLPGLLWDESGEELVYSAESGQISRRAN